MNSEMKKAEDVKVDIVPIEKEIEVIIENHVGFSLIAGAIPIPIVDIVAVSAIQIDMLKQMAKKYKIDFDDEVGKSLVTSILSTTIGTSIGRAGASAVKAIPGIGTLLGIGSQVVLSGITTFAVGNIFSFHFKKNIPLSEFNLDDVKDMFDDLLKKGKEYVDNIQNKTKEGAEEVKAQTAIVIKKMADNGVIKREDFEKLKEFFGEKKTEEDVPKQ